VLNPHKKLPKQKPTASSPRSSLEPWEEISDYSSHLEQIYTFLEQEFGEVATPLHFGKDYELCIAVILSAQCTDERVNQVTPALFAAFPTLESFANANPSDIEPLIFSTGFYRNKAKFIHGFAKMLKERFNSKLPKTLEEITGLPGFGRKTANVVLSELYGIVEGFVVDTHVMRLTYILGITKFKDPIRIEREVLEKVPKKYWKNLSLYLIFHGRKTCKARKPNCSSCGLVSICPSAVHFID
jgi:endonuclease-3